MRGIIISSPLPFYVLAAIRPAKSGPDPAIMAGIKHPGR
jgi:hypothetical protein